MANDNNIPKSNTPHFLMTKETPDDLKYPFEPARFSRIDTEKFFIWASEQGASDITIKTGDQIFLEIDGKMYRVTKRQLDHGEVMELVVSMYGSESAKAKLAGDSPLDFSYQISPKRNERYRYRINAVGIMVRGDMGCEITARTIPGIPPKLEELGIEEEIYENMCPDQGMIVVTGGTGSGKSTLLASIIRELLEEVEGHRKIITFEAPIEYVYDGVEAPTTSIAQTEIGKNLKSFVEGTKNALRRKPSIILLGEARDAETIGEAVTASMTGHLLYTTVHSNGYADTIRRMVNVFDEDKNAKATDIISSLKMVISQRLVPDTKGKRVAIKEYVVMNDEIVDFILEAGIENLTASCRKVLTKHGRSFLQDATDKYNQGRISHETWKKFARNAKAEELDALEILKKRSSINELISSSDLTEENFIDKNNKIDDIDDNNDDDGIIKLDIDLDND